MPKKQKREKFYAVQDPFSDKCYCPFCNSECAPDYCYGCHSKLDGMVKAEIVSADDEEWRDWDTWRKDRL